MNGEMTVSWEVERTSGRFASKEDIEAEIAQALEDANPGDISDIGANSDSNYDVLTWDISPVTVVRARGSEVVVKSATKQVARQSAQRAGDLAAAAEQMFRSGDGPGGLAKLEEARRAFYVVASFLT